MLQIQAADMIGHGQACHGLPIFHSPTPSSLQSLTINRHAKQSRQHHTPCATQASPAMTDDEPRALIDQSGSVTTASQASETSPTMSHGRGSRQDETHPGTVASPRRDLDSELDRQHRQYFPEMLQQYSQTSWASQNLKYEKDEEYSLSQIQAYDVRPSRRSARSGNEYKLYNNDELPDAWTNDSQGCLQTIPWRSSHQIQDTHDRRPPLAYHSDNFGLTTTMADVPNPCDLSAYAVTVADLKPPFHTIEPDYTDLVTGASVYPFYQTSSDGLPDPNIAGPGDDRLLSCTEESDHLMHSGREGPLPSMEPDLDPEDVKMDEDTKYNDVDSPCSKDPSDGKEPPYAKLIWKAFMSTPSRSMHLQQIYEWFRQNTDKADGTGTGWMNSIRHNLSMNKAFLKQNSKPAVLNSDGSLSLDANSGIDSRKSTEWVLDPKFYSGVKSTTRYRRPNGMNRSRGTSSGGRGKGARAGGGAGAGISVVGGSGAEGGSTSAASSARASAGRRGGHVAAQNRKRNRAAEKQQQQQQQQQRAMAPMAAAARDVSHNNRFHHAAAAMHPICDPQQLGKGAAAATGGGGFAYVDHHLGYPYPTSSPFDAADFVCGAGAGDGRLLGANYFTSQYHHNGRTLATDNVNISEPPTPPASVVDHYLAGSSHHRKTTNTTDTAAYFDDMAVAAAAAAAAAVSHDGYPTLTPTAGAEYIGMQPRQQQHDQQRQQQHGTYVGGVYEPRTGELPSHVYWDGDVPLASLSLDA